VDESGVRNGLQVIAALASLGLLFLLYRGLRRGLTAAVLALLMFSVPAAGFAFFVVNPVVGPYPTAIAWTAFGLVTVAAAVSMWSRRLVQPIREGLTTTAMLQRMRHLAIGANTFIVLALSTYLYIFEPPFALANLVVNFLWVAIWIPRRLRVADLELSIDVAAKPLQTWAFLLDASNALLYQDDLEDVTVLPPGPLQVGSLVTSRRRVQLIRPWLKMTELKMTLQALVTELVPGYSYAAVAVDRSVSSTYEVKPAGSGSRIVVRTRFVFSIAEGILGQMLMLPVGIARTRAISMQSMTRIKELLSSPG
jgi:hypothetical protein